MRVIALASLLFAVSQVAVSAPVYSLARRGQNGVHVWIDVVQRDDEVLPACESFANARDHLLTREITVGSQALPVPEKPPRIRRKPVPHDPPPPVPPKDSSPKPQAVPPLSSQSHTPTLPHSSSKPPSLLPPPKHKPPSPAPLKFNKDLPPRPPSDLNKDLPHRPEGGIDGIVKLSQTGDLIQLERRSGKSPFPMRRIRIVEHSNWDIIERLTACVFVAGIGGTCGLHWSTCDSAVQ